MALLLSFNNFIVILYVIKYLDSLPNKTRNTVLDVCGIYGRWQCVLIALGAF